MLVLKFTLIGGLNIRFCHICLGISSYDAFKFTKNCKKSCIMRESALNVLTETRCHQTTQTKPHRIISAIFLLFISTHWFTLIDQKVWGSIPTAGDIQKCVGKVLITWCSVYPVVMGTWWNDKCTIVVIDSSCRECAFFQMRWDWKCVFQYQGCDYIGL